VHIRAVRLSTRISQEMAPSISPKAVAALNTYIDNATAGSTPTIPGAVVHIIDAQANVLFSHSSSSTTTPPVKPVGIIHSLTKIVGAIAYLQLVERNITSLDDPTIITTHLPELAAKKVLTGYTTDSNGTKTWQLEDRIADITPRMLMNHTYGGGHTYMNQLLFDYFQDPANSIDWTTTNETADTYGTILASPLLFQPGTKTNYGQGLDWLAVLIERLTHQRLSTYLSTNIFDPLALTTMAFEPTFGGPALSTESYWSRTLRTPDGFLILETVPAQSTTRTDVYPSSPHHSGVLGTGLVSSAADYACLMTIFLPENAGTDPVTKHTILSPSSISEITTPQLSPSLRNNSRNVPASSAAPIVLPAHLQAPHMDPEGSYGLACGVQGADRVLADGGKGRRKGSVYWYGAANTEFWVDGESGIVAYVNGNYYPWNDEAWNGFVAGVEGLVYKGLNGET
jgi:CubicO group peptidase (beta-lactamase class C family)